MSALPLPIFPWPMSPERTALLRRAFEEIAPPFDILPSPAEPTSPGRILAFGRIQPFYHDATVLIRPENVDNYDSILGALRHVLTAPAGAPVTMNGEQWLSAVMGAPVKLVAVDTGEVVRERGPRFV